MARAFEKLAGNISLLWIHVLHASGWIAFMHRRWSGSASALPCPRATVSFIIPFARRINLESSGARGHAAVTFLPLKLSPSFLSNLCPRLSDPKRWMLWTWTETAGYFSALSLSLPSFSSREKFVSSGLIYSENRIEYSLILLSPSLDTILGIYIVFYLPSKREMLRNESAIKES